VNVYQVHCYLKLMLIEYTQCDTEVHSIYYLSTLMRLNQPRFSLTTVCCLTTVSLDSNSQVVWLEHDESGTDGCWQPIGQRTNQFSSTG